MALLLALPLVCPLASAVVCLLLARSLRAQRVVGIAGAAALLLTTIVLFVRVRQDGVLATAFGGWPAPLGITFVADHLAAVMVLMGAAIGLFGAVYAAGSLDDRRQRAAFFPLLHLLLAGVCGAVLTGDVFNLFVWFELMLVASFVLLILGSERKQLLGALKYVLPNLIASVLLLAGVALLYALSGTLNMADLARRLPELRHSGLVVVPALLFLAAFAIKGAAFPLFFWLPASYPAPPMAVTAVFSALLTKVAIYATMRLFTLVFVQDSALFQHILLVAGGLTMVTGVLGAVAEQDVKRLLAFHVVSQLGYMLMGIGLLTATALAATLYFVVHIMVTKTALFLVVGIVGRVRGSYDLERLGGLSGAHPGLAVLFILPALSLGGLPPASGFIGKLALLGAALSLEQYLIAAVAIGVSLLTLFSMTKVWTKAFWTPLEDAPPPSTPLGRAEAWATIGPAAVLAVLAVGLGVGAGPVFEVMAAAGRELADPSAYLAAALGAGA